MTTVRKRAMRSYLENNDKDSRKPRNSVSGQSQPVRAVSTGLVASNGSQDAMAANISSDPPSGFGGGTGKRPSSTARPATSRIQRSSNPGASNTTMDMISQQLMETTLIEGPRTDRVLPYDIKPTPLFKSFGEGVDPFRTMFQSSYPRVSVERMKFFCARFFGTKAMGMHWIPTVLSAPHTFLSTLCCASAHLDAILERDIESVETSLLRQEVMHLIGQMMVHPGQQADDLNVTSLIQLIVSEVIGREKISLKIHEGGLEKMVEVRGGLSQLGMRGYLASTCSWVLLESAILREESPRPIFVEYCASRSKTAHSPTAIVPESPLYRPRPHFDTLKNSRHCLKQTFDLLNDVYSMIDLFLQPTHSPREDSTKLASYYKNIMTKYPAISKEQKPQQDDYKYEAIRITAVLQATAIMQHIPLSEALPITASALMEWTSLFAASSRPTIPPSSPLSPMDLRHTSQSTLSSTYAEDILVPPPDSYFDGLRTSISSATASHSSTVPHIQHHSFSSIGTSHGSVSSSTCQPSLSSIASSNSSVSSIPGSYPLVKPSRSRPLLSTSTPPGDGNYMFADCIARPQRTASTDLLTHLKTILDASNLSEAWKDMAGVLLWIGMTFGAASHSVSNRILEKWYSALAMRASTLLSFQHPEPIHSTMLRMTQIVEALREAPSPSRTNPTMAGTGKKRRLRS